MTSPWAFLPLVAAAAVVAGAVASVAVFGIGSLLTPLLAVRTGTKLAVPEPVFRRVVSAVILALGVVTLLGIGR